MHATCMHMCVYSLYIKVCVSVPGILWLRSCSEHAFKSIPTFNLCWSKCFPKSPRYQVSWQTSQPPGYIILHLLYLLQHTMLHHTTLHTLHHDAPDYITLYHTHYTDYIAPHYTTHTGHYTTLRLLKSLVNSGFSEFDLTVNKMENRGLRVLCGGNSFW